VTVKATDDGVPAKSGEDAFELTVLEGTAPTVTEVSPAADATGVAVDATIRATFSEPVRAGVGSFTLQRGSEAVAAAVTMSDDRRVATLTPSAPLAHAAAYTATVRTPGTMRATPRPPRAPGRSRPSTARRGSRRPAARRPARAPRSRSTWLAEDPDAGQAVTLSAANLPEGLTMSAAGRISGTVARGEAGTRTVTLTARDDFDPSASATETFSLEVLEGTAPTVTSVSPADGATGVATGADVVATFSEPVKAGVELGLAKGTTAVAGTVTLNAARTQATFDPAQPLEFLTEYTATVAAAQDDAGNALASARAWTFRTADRPERRALRPLPASVAFASTETGTQRTQEVVLRNTADAGAKSITVSSVTVAGTDAAHFSDDEGGTLTLAPRRVRDGRGDVRADDHGDQDGQPGRRPQRRQRLRLGRAERHGRPAGRREPDRDARPRSSSATSRSTRPRRRR
jgi:methionine-rich copper-binding protein CopC